MFSRKFQKDLCDFKGFRGLQEASGVFHGLLENFRGVPGSLNLFQGSSGRGFLEVQRRSRILLLFQEVPGVFRGFPEMI